MKTKLSRVAKSGLIIPEPLANPVIATFFFPILISLDINFGLVSVVRIERAAGFQFFSSSCEIAFIKALKYCFDGKASPITPVEKGITLLDFTPNKEPIFLQ